MHFGPIVLIALRYSRGLRHGARSAFAITLLLALTARASANINLELRPSFQSVLVGNTISLGLYAVSDAPVSQSLSAVEVIVNWDPAFLSLTGDSMAGSPLLVGSPRFAADPYHFNDSLTDGDAMWIAFAPLGSPVAATSAGTLLGTFNFLALAPTMPGTSPIGLPPSDVPNTGAWPTRSTFVYHATIPNLNVVGTLTGATIQISVPAPPAMIALLGGLIAPLRRRR